MNMYWIYDIPSLELGLIIKAIFLTVSIAAFLATRGLITRHFPKSHEADQAVGSIFGAVGMLYGLLLGLVAVAVWQNYDKLTDLVDEEASCIIQLYRNVSVLKDPSRNLILMDIKNYTKDVIEVSWPAHQHGKPSPSAAQLISGLHKKIADYEPKANDQSVAYAGVTASFSEMVKARRMRINGVDIGVPRELWFVIIGGAILTIPITFFFHMPSLSTHLLLTSFYVVFLAGMIALIAILDNPMRGELSVSSEPYQKALDVMGEIDHYTTPPKGK